MKSVKLDPSVSTSTAKTASDATDAPRPGSRKAKKIATRMALLAATRRCMDERGWADTHISHIARAAGVAHGTFYVHFKNKEEVLDALLSDFNDALAERLAPVLDEAMDVGLPATVRACATAFIDHWQAHRSFVSSYAARIAAGADPQLLHQGLNPPMEALLLQGLQMAGAAAGAKQDWSLAAHAVLGMWLRVGLRHVLGDEGARDAAIDVLTRATVGALGALLQPGVAEDEDDLDDPD